MGKLAGILPGIDDKEISMYVPIPSLAVLAGICVLVCVFVLGAGSSLAVLTGVCVLVCVLVLGAGFVEIMIKDARGRRGVREMCERYEKRKAEEAARAVGEPTTSPR